MNENFAKLNYLNTKSIEEIKHFSALESAKSDLPVNEITTFQYWCPNDIKYADKWTYPQFDYKINHLGFRNDKIPTESDLAVFGCSFTFGTGLPVDMQWHTILANRLNTKADNYGIPGASIQSIINMALIVSNHTKLNRVVFLFPRFSRIQVAKNSPFKDEVNYMTIIPNHKSELCRAYGLDSEMIVKHTPDEEMFKQLRDSLYLVDYIFKQKNIQAYYSSWDYDTYLFMKQMELEGTLLPEWSSTGMEQATTDLARDNLHPGPVHQQQFVDKIIDYIK